MTISSDMSSSLQTRLPGQAVIGELLRIQRFAPRRTWWRSLFGVLPLTSESVSWYQGALGEISVGKLLARLGPEWTVLHAVPIGSGTSDIDHVLIGPGGVFTVNTKHHAGKRVWVAGRSLLVAGQPQRHIPNAVHEAGRAARLLSTGAGEAVAVSGLIAIVGAAEVRVKQQASGVTVLNAARLIRWLRRRPRVLSQDQLRRIVAVAELPATWHRHPADESDGHALRREFDQLHGLVRRARRIRIAWAVLIMLVIVLLALTLTLPLFTR